MYKLVFTCMSTTYKLFSFLVPEKRRTFATSSEICSRKVSGLSLEMREQITTMSRTRNTITMARGTIAENARRQLSLINRCQMPRTVRRDWRFN